MPQPAVVRPPLLSKQTAVPAEPVMVPAVARFTSVPVAPVSTGLVPSCKVVVFRAVKAPVLGVVTPIGQGDSHVQPSSSDTLRFGTCVVLVTENGAVPVAKVLVICPEKLAVVALNPPVKFGVPAKVGLSRKVPVSVPPAAKMLGPLLVNPELKVTELLKVAAAFH